MAEACSSPILNALSFPEFDATSVRDPDRSRDVTCPLCDMDFHFPDEKDVLFAHLVAVHNLVIGEVSQIHDIPGYVNYWKRRFTEAPLTEFASVIRTNTKREDLAPQEDFFFLCDALPEDKALRERLKQRRLEFLLDKQQKERQDANFAQECVLCSRICRERNELFAHLCEEHAFSLGNPDGIVDVPRFMEVIKDKLDANLCLFCEKEFRDQTTLKEHMRKKRHRKLNPKNKEYDQFYLINYVELGRNWESLKDSHSDEDELDNYSNSEHAMDEDDDQNWEDWVDDDNQLLCFCLFCSENTACVNDTFQHMLAIHEFDFQSVTKKHGMDFYQKVKCINYIRRCVYSKLCMRCSLQFTSQEQMISHMKSAGHFLLPDESKVWDQPSHLFPTYENDMLLSALSDDDEDEDTKLS